MRGRFINRSFIPIYTELRMKRPKRRSHSPFGVPKLPHPEGSDNDVLDNTSGSPTELPSTPVVEEDDLPAPDLTQNLVANRYEILDRIGSGGMGEVYKVRHIELGKIFALKILHSEMSENPRVREMFYSEARLASSLEHRHIVSITDFGEDIRRGAFIVMEYLHGESLAERLEKTERLDVKTSCDIIQQTAEALQYMHSSGVVHGDIKPENIFLTLSTGQRDRRKNLVKVLDFGLSRISMPHGASSDEHLSGTPAYLAPERICGAPPNEKSDLYSLGVLFYEVLTGKLPFDGSIAQILDAHLSTSPSRPSSMSKDPMIKEGLDHLVLYCLSKEPYARHDSVAVFNERLVSLISEMGIFRRRRNTPQVMGTRRPGDATCRNMVDSNPLPMFAVDTEGNITLTNKSFALFVKDGMNRLVGRNLLQTRLGRFAPGLKEDLQHVLQKNKFTSRELEFVQEQGENSIVLVWLSPLMTGGSITGAHGIVHWVKR